jgi:integrase
MPKAYQAIEAWATVARLKPGEAVSRPVDQFQIISIERLTDRSVSRIVKARVKALVRQRGRSKEEAKELVELISGHSLRAGYATSAAARNMPTYRIQSHTRHKSAQMVAGYIRDLTSGRNQVSTAWAFEFWVLPSERQNRGKRRGLIPIFVTMPGGTAITTYLENGGTLENAMVMAAHASVRTTQLYDRRRDDVTLDEVVKINMRG